MAAEPRATDTTELVRAGGEHVPGLLRAVEARLREDAAAHAAPLEQHGVATVEAGGKRLRPLLVLLAAGPPSGSEQEQALIEAAAAVELVHSATLVHDDVLDAADLRRGQPTVVAQGGRAMAVATGDALFARAFAALTQSAEPEAVRLLSDACSALARGELLQRADAWDTTIDVERYLLRCELKTARLFEAACRLGPLATAQPQVDLGGFGRRIGLGFQILDDVLDVSGPVASTGKHRGTDLLDGTVTLPLIVARGRDEDLARVELRSVSTGTEAEALCDRIAATGALETSRERALDLVAQAKRELDENVLGRERTTALALVADSVVERYR